jgi:hypothetical protein
MIKAVFRPLLALLPLLVGPAGAQVNPGGGGGGSGGTVTSIATSCGISGGPITTTGTLSGSVTTNPQTGTTYTQLAADCGKLLTFTNASSIAVTLSSANFAAGNYLDAIVLPSSVGSATFTPSSGTINGSSCNGSSCTLSPGSPGGTFVFDGTNWEFAGSGTGPSVLGSPPYVTGASMWYTNPYTPSIQSTSVVGVANSYYFVPFYVWNTVTIKGAVIRVGATSTGNSSAALQGAFYRDIATTTGHRPGTLIDYTTSFPTGATGGATATLNNGTDSLPGPGIVWFGIQKFDATATYGAASDLGGPLYGATIGTNNYNALLGASTTVISSVSITGTAFGGSNWPNFTSSTSWTENFSSQFAPYVAIEVN